MKFIDSNVLFRMFAASGEMIRRYREAGSCGNRALDYAIGLLLRVGEGGYSTSELALLETVSVAARLGGKEKAGTLFRAVLTQEGLQILETRALAYPLSFALVLTYGLEARDSLHLAVATLSGVSILTTSDVSFADGTESVIKQVTDQGFQLPTHIRAVYRLTDEQATFIERQFSQSLSILSVERAPG